MRKVGVDVGYGWTKVYTSDAMKKLRSSVHPVFVETGLQFSSAPIVEHGGRRYLIGTHRSVDLRRSDFWKSDYFMVLLLHSLSETVKEREEVLLATGLPVSYSTPQAREELKERLTGKHRIGDTYVFIKDVVVTAQSLASLLDYLIVRKGTKFEVDRKRREEKVLVVDIGFYTADIVPYEREVLVEEGMRTIELGVSHLYELVLQELQTKEHPAVPLTEVEEIVRRGYAVIRGEKVPVDLTPHKQVWSERLASILTAHEVELSTYDTILVVGGGATLVDESVFGRKVVIPTSPEFANARGYYKLLEVR